MLSFVHEPFSSMSSRCISNYSNKAPSWMQRARPESIVAPVALLEHLTGPSRGTATWVGERKLNVTLGAGRLLNVSAAEPADDDGEVVVARLRRSDGTYEIEAVGGRLMWVNGRPVHSRQLEHHDMIEFSDTGPLSRVYLYQNGQPRQINVGDILSDAVAYFRSSRQPLGKRLTAAAIQILRRLARETTLLFRIGVIVALIGLGFVAYQQSRINTLLRRQIETGATQLESFSRLLAQARKEALTPADLSRLREELSGRLTTATKRLSELEHRSTAIARVIAKSRSSILFLQGAYAFREKVTGRMLRHAVGEDGHPLLSVEGKGPVAERQFTGTGFALADDGIIVTSRHIGQPWLYDVNVKALAVQGLEPVLIKFIAYCVDTAQPAGVALIRASKVADVALLRLEKPLREIKGLQLAERLPKPGEEVIVIGYPTGIRSMVAQAGAGFIKKLEQEEKTDFWSVATRLAAAGRIVPLASRGIVGRISQETIVYDAETTYGGSGGPVLDIDGSVVAINAAILPEYGGSNLGVPVSELRRLIAEAKVP